MSVAKTCNKFLFFQKLNIIWWMWLTVFTINLFVSFRVNKHKAKIKQKQQIPVAFGVSYISYHTPSGYKLDSAKLKSQIESSPNILIINIIMFIVWKG